MSLNELCSIGDLFHQIMECYHKTGNANTPLLNEFIRKVEQFLSSNEIKDDELQTQIQELKDNNETGIFATLKSSIASFFQSDNIARSSLSTSDIRRVKPIELFVKVLKSFLTKDAIVRNVLKEVGSAIGEEMIDTLKKHNFSSQPLSSSERDLKTFFESLQKNCEKLQGNQRNSYDF